MSDASSAQPANGNGAARRRWLIILGAIVLAGVIVWGLYWFLHARFFESTDDAYVGGDVVAITSREPATVLAIHADNTQGVKRGQVLIEFDPARPKAAMSPRANSPGSSGRAVHSIGVLPCRTAPMPKASPPTASSACWKS